MNTKEKILKVAEKLFMSKGIDRTGIREIAQSADINVAALNYHFKSKENLFDTIFERILSAYTPKLLNVLDENLELDEKIKKYIDTYLDILLENDQLPFFIISVINRNPQRITRLKIFKSLYNSEVFAIQLKEEARKGKIRTIDPYQFFVNMLSLIGFPFAIKYVIMEENKLNEQGYNQFIKERKKIIYELLILDLKCNH